MRLLSALVLIVVSGCRAEEPTNNAMDKPVDSSLPGPQRAKAAAERVEPLLKPRLEKLSLTMGSPLFLRAFKEEKLLEVWMKPAGKEEFVLFETYPIAGVSGQLGPKTAEGDRQIPEGFYYFGSRHLKPDSRYHLAFNIGYPNAYDRHHGRTGSFIMVHGSHVSIGCLAMTDAKIEEIYTLCNAALQDGQPFIRIHLFPFRMTTPRLERAKSQPHFKFWQNLKEGYDAFESHKRPPEIQVQGGNYQIQNPGP